MPTRMEQHAFDLEPTRDEILDVTAQQRRPYEPNGATVDEAGLIAYLQRIGVTRPPVLDDAALSVLHRAHQEAVPFENLSIHLGEPISLVEHRLLDKIVRRRRGGFCYELNGAFAALLAALGADVRMVAARVYGDRGRLGPPMDHLALIVRSRGGQIPWLVDVGFGRHSVLPLRFDSRTEQIDAGGRFLLVDVEESPESGPGDVDVFKDGAPQYRIETHPRCLADFAPTCWWQQTSSQSHFTRSVICSRLTAQGRISLNGRTLIRTEAGRRVEEQLDNDDDVLTAYRTHFDMALDRLPLVAPAHSGELQA
jgi:N-hydroxyarylamine O-acetyltransferase